jgi:hypothetical protein
MSKIITPNVPTFRTPEIKVEKLGGTEVAICQDTDIIPGLDPNKVAPGAGRLNVTALCEFINMQSAALHAAMRELVFLRKAMVHVLDSAEVPSDGDD